MWLTGVVKVWNSISHARELFASSCQVTLKLLQNGSLNERFHPKQVCIPVGCVPPAC